MPKSPLLGMAKVSGLLLLTFISCAWQVMKLIDLHDLYGSVAYPKRHTQNDISDIYLFPRSTHGVFTNIALQEPFGLTVIEVRRHCCEVEQPVLSI